ncbi:M20/M25/M40 family metallo-hydrolase [uncultured Agrococcus sp.]|uniref:M20/M25/M40 family metallo-hydrolase n=1 Tax=uncultured Agrococcus sp. TaxID=382258 RepID=UPI0025F6EF8A|nr:M20/M25/M40 family metallo-hydrolase [uncultured Agrococcus sp.]
MEISDADAQRLLADLVRIDSTNPELVAGGAGESEIADFATSWLEPRGFDCRRLESTPGRPSVVATYRGGRGKRLMLNGHLDTVTLAGYSGNALEPLVQGGRMHGRGTYDMKAGVAAMMTAAAGVARAGHGGDIVLALVADEEHASIGTQEVLAAGFTADAAIVVEPTGLDIVTAHRGFVWLDITVHGRAGHGSRRDLGVDAIAHTGRVLTALAEHDRVLAGRPPHPLLGTANLHAATINGGEERSSYPAECTVAVEYRTLPGDSAENVERELRAIVDDAIADSPCSAEVRVVFERSPFHIDQDADIVRAVANGVEAETGRAPELPGEAFWTDCALLADAGIPTVLFGVDGGGAHAEDEWVDLASFRTVTKALTRVIEGFGNS